MSSLLIVLLFSFVVCKLQLRRPTAESGGAAVCLWIQLCRDRVRGRVIGARGESGVMWS